MNVCSVQINLKIKGFVSIDGKYRTYSWWIIEIYPRWHVKGWLSWLISNWQKGCSNLSQSISKFLRSSVTSVTSLVRHYATLCHCSGHCLKKILKLKHDAT